MDIELLGLLMSATILALLILTVAGVVLLRPLSHRLGDLLEAMAKERSRSAAGRVDRGRTEELLEVLAERVSLLEERQDFIEALQGERSGSPRIGSGERHQAPAGE